MSGEKGEITVKQVFGERALRTKEPRAATITCLTDCVLLFMSGTDFNMLLGPVIDLIDDKN